MPLRATPRRAAPAPRVGYRAVGRVQRPWGLRGELKVRPFTDFPQRFEPGARVFLAGEPRVVAASHWRSGSVYVRFDSVSNVTDAEALRGELLEVPEEERPAFTDGEYYIDEIEGCSVNTESGERLGTVREVLRPGANDVYVVARPGRRDLLVPAIADVIRHIDIAARRIVVDLPDGLDPEEQGV